MVRLLLLQLLRCPRRQHRTALAIGLVTLGLFLMSMRWALHQPQWDEEAPTDAAFEESLVTLETQETHTANPHEVAVVVLASRRPEVQQLLHQLLATRPTGFRILVSQDGTEPHTAETLSHFGSAVTRLRFSGGRGVGDSYVRISHHHQKVLDHVFLQLHFRYAIVMEDDLVIAPDFYSYFSALKKVLDSDPSVFCVSAWNDNGLVGLVKDDPTLVHRTDFFPGLGWMTSRSHWSKVRSHWPDSQYDDFLRKYMLKESLVCLRPEISRTFNIGRCGGRIAGAIDKYGQMFYQRYLSRIVLNNRNVSLPDGSIRHVIGRSADEELQLKVRDIPEMKLDSLLAASVPPQTARLSYRTAQDFLHIAQRIGIIPEVWFGSPRAAILGIVTVSIRGCRVFIAPDIQLELSDDIVTAADEEKLQVVLTIWGSILLSLGCLLMLLHLITR